MNEQWFVYVILCEDGSLYKGHTNNIERLSSQHCSGTGALHTKRHKPVKIVYTEQLSSLEEAVKREKYLKSGIGREWLKQQIKEL